MLLIKAWMDGWLGFLQHFKHINNGYIMPEIVFLVRPMACTKETIRLG